MSQPATKLNGTAGSPPAEMPLTSIERFHLLSSTAAHPNSLFCRVIFAGGLQRERLEAAIDHVVGRHHILSRRLSDSNGEPTWINESDCQASMLTWMQSHEDSQLDASFMPTARDLEAKLDLHSTPATHIWYLPLVSTPSQSTPSHSQETDQAHVVPASMLFFAIHHSVTDGLGGARIVNEILIAYYNLCAGLTWNDGLRQLDASGLPQRHRLGLNRWSYWKHFWKQPIALVGMCKFLFRRFHVIGATDNNATSVPIVESDSQTQGLIGRWISEDLSDQVDRMAAEKSISANSIAMASVFYALRAWAGNQNDGPVEKWIRMVLPISIASKDDLRSPSVNRATIVQVDRSADQMRDFDSFLYYLDREVKIIVGWQFDKLFLLMVRLMSVSGWWLRRSATNPRARGTVVFTNLGQAFRSVDKRVKKLTRGPASCDHPAEIVEFDFAGPTRSQMPLSFTIQRHQQRYRISARFDGRVLTTAQASSFLEQVETELSKIAAGH